MRGLTVAASALPVLTDHAGQSCGHVCINVYVVHVWKWLTELVVALLLPAHWHLLVKVKFCYAKQAGETLRLPENLVTHAAIPFAL